MKLASMPLLVGVASAFAFEPVGWWPLMLRRLRRALRAARPRAEAVAPRSLIGLAFGFGQFVVSLNWIATAFTFQSADAARWAGSRWSCCRSTLPLSRARDRRRVAVRARQSGGAGARPRRRLGDHRMAARTLFTGFPWNPAAAAMAPTPLITISALTGTYGLSGLVVLLGGAVWLEVLSAVAAAGADLRRDRPSCGCCRPRRCPKTR